MCYRDIKRQWSITHTGTHPNCQRPVRQWIPLSIFFFQMEEEGKKNSVCVRGTVEKLRETPKKSTAGRELREIWKLPVASADETLFFFYFKWKRGELLFLGADTDMFGINSRGLWRVPLAVRPGFLCFAVLSSGAAPPAGSDFSWADWFFFFYFQIVRWAQGP